MTHFFQQDHTHSHKVVSLNSAILYEIIGAYYIQTTTFS